MATKVTDPALLAKLNGGEASPVPAKKKVTDPALLQKLNTVDPAAIKATEDTVNRAKVGSIPILGPILGAGMDAYNDITKNGKDSYVGNAMSGINEGLSNAAALPGAIAQTALSIGPTVSNAVLGTNFKQPDYVPDVGNAAKSAMEDTGMIGAPSADPGKQFVRRVGQSVGATLPFAAAAPAAAITSAVTGGIGAATAKQLFPNNPWAELAGEVIGGFGPTVVGGMVKRIATSNAAPTVEELNALKNDAYKAADSLGVKYTPKAYNGMVGKVEAAVKADNISVTRHPKAASFVEDMKSRGANGLTLTEMDQLRQEVRRDLLRSTDEAEQHFGKVIMRQIDDFIGGAGQGDLISGNAADANLAIKSARELNTRFRKTELIDDALYAAKLRTASTGSGGNINNVIRQELKKILLNDKDRASFSAAEIKQMENVVKQGKGEELLRLVGKLSPNGNGLMMALGLGGTIANPALATLPIAGALAKGIADAQTAGKVANLRANVARGGGNGAALQPIFTPTQAMGGAALTAGIAANENNRLPRGAALSRTAP
jgi:hypothetical protein